MCALKILLGIPCITCGMTRSIISFLNLELKRALYYHPLFPLVLIYIFLGILHVFKIRYLSKLELYSVGILLFVVYFVRMYYYFPNTPPMDYEPNNLLNFIIMHLKAEI